MTINSLNISPSKSLKFSVKNSSGSVKDQIQDFHIGNTSKTELLDTFILFTV